MEPRNSEFYSVAPDRELSSIVKREIGKLIEASPAISSRFKVKRSEIDCLLNNSKMIPLARSENRMDGKHSLKKYNLPSLNRAISVKLSKRQYRDNQKS